jgi:hypothetical protein
LAGLQNAAQTDGIFANYGGGSTTMKCHAVATSTDTSANGPTVTANQWYRWDAIKFAGDGTLHEYFDGVECGTGFTSGQWPTVIANPVVNIVNSAGTSTTRKADFDWFRLRICRPTRFAS